MTQLTRRDFLRLCGTSSIGLALAACGVTPTPTVTPAPTKTALPMNTPLPTATAALTNTPAPTSTITPIATPHVLTMRDYADNLRFKIGAAISYYPLFDFNNKRVSNELHQKYRAVLKSFCNLGVIHHGFYWDGYEPERGKISADSMRIINEQLSWLSQMGIQKVRAHPLIYPKYTPEWLRKGVKNGDIKRDEFTAIMKNHIKEQMESIRGITEYVVVNEPYRHYADDDDFFQTVIGDEYIDIAFQTAREVNLRARLIFNDLLNHTTKGFHSIYNVPNGNRTADTQKIVQRLKAKGLIDTVGLQMHLDGSDNPDWEDIQATMKSYGVPVEITEFSVDMRNVKGTEEEKSDRQADIYKRVLATSLASSVCTGFTVWGLGDGFTAAYRATPFDENLEPKPAYFAMLQFLQEYYGKQSPIAIPTSTKTP